MTETLQDWLVRQRGAQTIDAWVETVLRPGGYTGSRQAVEHYLSGRRVPEPDLFRQILTALGLDPRDPDAWALWTHAKGGPAPQAEASP